MRFYKGLLLLQLVSKACSVQSLFFAARTQNVFDCLGAKYCVVNNCVLLVLMQNIMFRQNGESRHSENPFGKPQKGIKN